MFPRAKKFIVSVFTAVIVAVLLIGAGAAGAAGGDLDPTFNNQGGTGANGTVHAIMVQPDGKILIGGGFTAYNGDTAASDNIMRLNADGTRDTTFNASGVGASSDVLAVAVQGDGKVLIGGGFTAYNTDATASDHIMRLNADGTRDTTFNANGAGADSTVYAMALQPNGKIIIGGNLTSYNGDGTASDYVMRLNADGTRDTTFNPNGTGANVTVYAIALQPDGKIIISGEFFIYNGDQAASNYVMRLNADGTRDTTFNPNGTGAGSAVFAVALQPNGKVLIAGNFNTYNNNFGASDYIMRLNADGTHDISFNPGGVGANGSMRAVAIKGDGKILIGGAFSTYNGDAAASDRIMQLNGDGTRDTSFNTNVPYLDIVHVIAVQPDGKVLIGGYFTTYNGYVVVRDGITRLLAAPPNTAPVASTPSGAASTNEDTSVQITLIGTDADDNDLSFTITDQPDHGTLSSVSAADCAPVNNCTANVTYTPAPNYNGSDFFKFRVNDRTADSAEVTVPITVNPASDLSISDVTQAEGNTGTSTFTFIVSLDSPAPVGGVTFDICTADGTAQDGIPQMEDTDYIRSCQAGVRIPAGAQSYQFSVAVNGDTKVESDETFGVTLSGATNAAIFDGQGIGTIKNDDAPRGSLRFNASAYSVSEGTGAATITVLRTGGSGGPVAVDYTTGNGTATAGADYTATSGTLHFADGVTSQTFNVSITSDTLDESDETVNLSLSSPAGGASLDMQSSAVLTVVDDDPPPTLSVNDVTVTEGNNGATDADLVITLSPASGRSVTVNYSTSNGTATSAVDYVAASGTLTFSPGETTKIVTVAVIPDSTIEPDETFFLNVSGASNATVADGQGMVTIKDDDSVTLRFGAATYSVGEGAGRVNLTVTRAGDISAASTVDYRTVDTDTFTFGCADTVNNSGGAYARCDFATVVGTLQFAAGEVEKTISVPVIDDAHVEGSETFQVTLSNPAGAAISQLGMATVTITDNDAARAQNPVVASLPFFVRQQYLDFLSREPDTSGFNAWLTVLNNCSDPFSRPTVLSACDRIFVSGEGFFRSPEFQLKGFYVFRFYKAAFNRLPEYLEVVADMSYVAGQTETEVYDRKAQLATLITERQEFQTLYSGMTNTQYVNVLLGRYRLTQVTTPDPAQPDGSVKVTLAAADLANRLAAGTLTRAQVLRAVADSEEVGAEEFQNAFVGMQYYGYLRRKPDAEGFRAWLGVLQNGGGRIMVDGFLNSVEYKLRFGQP